MVAWFDRWCLVIVTLASLGPLHVEEVILNVLLMNFLQVHMDILFDVRKLPAHLL